MRFDLSKLTILELMLLHDAINNGTMSVLIVMMDKSCLDGPASESGADEWPRVVNDFAEALREFGTRLNGQQYPRDGTLRDDVTQDINALMGKLDLNK